MNSVPAIELTRAMNFQVWVKFKGSVSSMEFEKRRAVRSLAGTITSILRAMIAVIGLCMIGCESRPAIDTARPTTNTPQTTTLGPEHAPDSTSATDSALFRYVFDIPDEYINDHSLVYDGQLWHLYFIEGFQSTTDVWYRDSNETLIGHATSPNLFSWKLESPALRTGPPGSLDEGHVIAPNVIERDGRYYMFYGGKEAHVAYRGGEHILLATSTDLYTWKRHSPSPIHRPDTTWAWYRPVGYLGSSGGPVSFRDAHLLADSAYGYVLYYVAQLRGDRARGTKDGEYSCIAAATSRDLLTWVDRGPVVVRKSLGTEANDRAHPESPCVIKREGIYYLFWKGGNGTRYVVGRDPLHFFDEGETFLATSHASEIFEWKGQWYITSCSRSINDILHRYSDRTKGLFLAGIEWDGTRPYVVKLDDTASAGAGTPGR